MGEGGIYVLVIENRIDNEIEVGRLGKIAFRKGYYAYVGSAKRGLEKRIKRHLSREKKLYWHIDYFLNSKGTAVMDVLTKRIDDAGECEVARSLGEKFESIMNFGSSDCSCSSHLFHCDDLDRLKEALSTLFG